MNLTGIAPSISATAPSCMQWCTQELENIVIQKSTEGIYLVVIAIVLLGVSGYIPEGHKISAQHVIMMSTWLLRGYLLWVVVL